MPGALGQTTNPRDLIPGDPEQIAADLRALVDMVERVDDAGDRLSRIDAANWKGDASKAFHTTFGAEPAKWARAAELLSTGGQALADYGTTLVWGQGEAQRAIELYTQAQAATRQAAVTHDTRVQFGIPVDPFTDPGAETAREAQAILDNARRKVAKAGTDATMALGIEPDDKGGFTKKLSDKNYGTNRRKTHQRWDNKQKKWVDDDPGGWQKTKGGRSYQHKWGSQSDGLLTDTLGDTLKELGIKLPEKTWASGAGVDVAHGTADRQFHTGVLSGHCRAEGSVLGADGEWHAGASPLGVTAGASGEAYLGKGSVSGEIRLGKHIEVESGVTGTVGAHGSINGTIGPFGGQAGGHVFVGGELNEHGSAEIGGVTAGGHAGAQFGVGAGANVQASFGDDGKFHVDVSANLAVGAGANIGFDVSIDPIEVANTMNDAAKAVGHSAESVAEGLANGMESLGKHLIPHI